MKILFSDFSNVNDLKSFNGRRLLEEYYYNRYDSKFTQITNDNFKIINVQKIYNSQLYGLYLLWKEELKTLNSFNSSNESMEKILYHATSPQNAISIAHSNIDWRKTRRSRFGIGACFSPSPKYAHKYCSKDGAFVICNVLVKNIETLNDINYNLEVPNDEKCDTTLGNSGMVYVKYDDYQFYPEFIVNYKQ